MTKEEKGQTPEKKIARTRRRLYDALPEEGSSLPTIPPTPRIEDSIPLPEAKTAPETSSVSVAPEVSPAEFAKNMVVKPYARMTVGTALIPIPLVDMAAGLGVQLKMIKTLSELYGINFSEQRVKAIIASLVGGLHIGLFTGSLLKFVPVIGLAGGVVSMGAISYAITYAIGVIFIRHFENGGNLLNFNLKQAQQAFPQAVQQGRQAASEG